MSAYRDSIANWESHSLEPFVDFLCQVAQSSKPVVLENSVVNFLLQLYVTNFRDPLATTEPAGFHRQSTLYAACSRFLAAVSDSKKGLDLIYGHPLHVIWSKQPQLAFTTLVQNRELRRIDMWRLTNREYVFWRIHSTFDMMLDWTRSFDDLFLVDVAVDLLELSG